MIIEEDRIEDKITKIIDNNMFFAEYGKTILIIGSILLIIFFLIIISKLRSIEDETWRTREEQERITELLIQQNMLLERIAYDLEQEQEPYIIENEDY